jgi:hypothetical protein
MPLYDSAAIPPDARRARARTLAPCGFVGPVLFTTLVILQGALIPEHSHVRLPISALAAWPTGWIQNVNFFVAGLLTIAFAYGLHLRVQRPLHLHVGHRYRRAGAVRRARGFAIEDGRLRRVSR